MKCNRCQYYQQGSMDNKCNLVGWENYRTQDYCELVNDDGTVNEEELKKDCY